MYASRLSQGPDVNRPWLLSKIGWFADPVFQYTALYMAIMSVSGAPAIAAWKIFVCVTVNEVWYPPHECPCSATRFGSTMPVATAAFTAGTKHHTADMPGSLTLYTMSGVSTAYPLLV